MRRILAAILLIAAGWSAYWGLGYQAQKSAIENWITTQRQAGWTVDIDNLGIAGFPYRFDTTFTGLTLSDPSHIWAWEAPAFQILALSYKPNHIIAAWPGKHILDTRAGQYAFDSDLMRASLVFRPDTSVALERLQLEASETALEGPRGFQANAGTITLALFADPAAADTQPQYRTYAKLGEAKLAREWRNLIDPESVLPDTITEAHVDAALVFDRPWDRAALQSRLPALRNISLKGLALIWGEVTITGTGEARILPDGSIEGSFDLFVQNWRPVFQATKAAGVIPAEDAGKIEYGINLLAALSANPDNVKVPLKFANGNTYLGPMVIADAPRFRY